MQQRDFRIECTTAAARGSRVRLNRIIYIPSKHYIVLAAAVRRRRLACSALFREGSAFYERRGRVCVVCVF